jgi:hypothetical protein
MKTKSTPKELRIDNKCSMNWDAMPSIGKDKDCLTCKKIVIDFSQSTEEEIIQYFTRPRLSRTCARFTETQLVEINTTLQKAQNSKLKNLFYAAMIVVMLTVTACGTSRRTYHKDYLNEVSKIEILAGGINQDSLNFTLIRGTIVDIFDSPLIGVSLFLNDKELNQMADIGGNFTISIDNDKVENTILKTSYIGYTDFEVEVKKIANKEVKITLVEDQFQEMIIIGEVVYVKQPIHKRLWNGVKNIFN